MANIQVPPDSTGKKVDTVTLSDAGSEVHRQKVVIAGGSGTAEVAVVTSGAAGAGVMALAVRYAGPQTLDGISKTVSVQFSTPQIIDSISKTVSVVIAAGQILDSISKTINAAVSFVSPQIVDSISKTVNASVVFASPQVINNISATVNCAVKSVYVNAAVPSASRGPRCVLVSTSANVTLIAAPGAGMSIYITQVNCTNASGTNTRARIGTSASIGQVTMMMAASGGGFVAQYLPIWMLSSNEALLGSVKPNASEGIFNVHYFVASSDAL